MTGDVQEIEKESFWREHQDTLVRIREELASGKKSRSKFSPVGGVRKRTPNKFKQPPKASSHPPFGKYRRTPSPYLPKLSPPPDQHGNRQKPNSDFRSSKYEVVPPVIPKVAFNNPSDYDSWGEDSEEDDEEEKENRPKKGGRRGYKPQPYPSPMPAYMPPTVVYGAPFPLYYPPPPPKRNGKNKKSHRKSDNNRGYRDIYHNKKPHSSYQDHSSTKKAHGKKQPGVHHSMPMYAAPYPMMPAMPMMYPAPQEEDESEDEMISKAFRHFQKHPLFAEDFATWFLHDCLDTDLIPDFLIDVMNEIKHMPYDHPLYIPTLYSCEDFLGDQISEMVSDVVREVAAEAAEDYLDEELLKHDPLEDFLTDLIDDVVRQGTREVVRNAVVTMAEDYMETEFASGIIDNLVDDYVDEIVPDLLEEVQFEIIAEEFIEEEVIAPEVKDEAGVIARETIQHLDNKVMRREMKEVMSQAKFKLTDSIMMDYLLSLMTQQGKLWGEEDHFNKFLDDFVLNTSLAQLFNIKKQREKTLECKPLHKLHEKVVSDVALDVFLQQLTRSLDEDLADVDEYERGVTDGVLQPIPSIVR